MEKAKVTTITKQGGSGTHRIPNRAARLYWSNQELQPTYVLSSPRALQSNTTPILDNPLVVVSIVAGVVGVVLIAVLILGVWIRSKLVSQEEDLVKEGHRRRVPEHVDVGSTIIMSSTSMSTLDENETNETQMDSIRLDDTTFSANDVSIPIDHNVSTDFLVESKENSFQSDHQTNNRSPEVALRLS